MISSTRLRRSFGSRSVWTSSTSAIWSPTRSTGLSAVIGSWNTIAMRVPRMARRSASDLVVSSSPSSRIEPLSTAIAAFGSKPITACAVTDLPEPDSPTTQTISLAATVRLMPRTACGRSPLPLMATERLATSRTGALMSDPLRHLGIERVAQAIAQYVDGENSHRKTDAGIDDVVREQAEHLPALGDDVTPSRNLRRHTDAEERQDRLNEDRGRTDERALHDNGCSSVGQNMPPQQFRRRRAERYRRLHIRLFPHAEHDRAHQTD